MTKKHTLTDEAETTEMEDFADATYEEETVENVKAPGYRFFSVILLLIAVAGLLIAGMSKWFEAFKPLVTAGPGAWKASMLFVIIETFKGLFGGTSTVDFGLPADLPSYADNLEAVLSYVPLLIALAVVVSLVMTIAALASGKAAKGCFYVNAFFVFFSYGTMFVGMYGLRALCGAETLIDLTMAIIAGAALLVLIVNGLIKAKGFWVVNFLLLALGFASAYALFYETSYTLAQMDAAMGYNREGMELVSQICILVLSGLIMINCILAVFRLNARRGYGTICLLFLLQLAAAVAVTVVDITQNEVDPFWSNIMTLPGLLLLFSSLAAFLLALVGSAVRRGYKKAEAEFEEDEDTEEYEDLPELTDTTAEAPAAAAAAPAAETVPVVQQVYPAAPAANYPYPVTNIYMAAQPAPAPQPAPQAQPAPQPAPAPQQPASREMTEFEASMAALARGEQPAAKPAPQPAARPAAQPIPAPAPQPAAQQPAGKYTYDPFINSLTEEEKNEFGDLFISKKYGTSAYLPTYVIGGDNKDFFLKVFIYLGKFRTLISDSLLNKLYVYVNYGM